MSTLRRIYNWFYKHLVFNYEDWHFYTITYDGNDTKLYIDGKEFRTDRLSMTAWFKGSINDVEVNGEKR